MPFGSCCIELNNNFYKMKPKYVKMEGFQKGMIINFEITQAFQHNQETNENVSYIFPNDYKLCIYDTTFVVGDEIIKPKLTTREEALELYKQAFNEGKTTVYGSNIAHGLSEFKLGNIPPKVECKVIIKVAFSANLIDKKTFMIKFPLDVCTPSGSVNCLNIKKNFNLLLQVDKDKIMNVTSNVINAKFDKATKMFSISEKIVNSLSENTIIIKFHASDLKSFALLAPTDIDSNYNYCALTVLPNNEIFHEDKQKDLQIEKNQEFVFVVDCSGSMSGGSIMNARECLEIFIRSLPIDSYFNIIRFGSSYVKLFDESMKYNEETILKAFSLINKLDADLGGTNIFNPLQSIFENKPKHVKRKIFLLTDGEVDDSEQVINLVERYAKENICSTIGLGYGSDSGLLEAIARATGGKYDFVSHNDSITDKVINQLHSSMTHCIENIEIHIDGEQNDSFQLSPYPLPNLMCNNGICEFIRIRKKQSKNKDAFINGILINGTYKEKTIDIPIDDFEQLYNVQEDKFGCSKGLNIGKAILSLFSFDFIQKYEKMNEISIKDKEKAIKLSLISGILCKYTGYIGMIEESKESYMKSRRAYICRCICGGQAPKEEHLHPFVDCFLSDDDNDDDDDNYENENNECVVTSSFNLMKILRLQYIDGSWNNIDEINQMIGENIDHIDGININDKTLEKKVIATLVAIASMRIFASEKRNMWYLIEKKAIDWLTKSLPNENVESFLSTIEELIEK